ncbi:MAG: MerR family transcriptional regulator [Oceanococcus sp.]
MPRPPAPAKGEQAKHEYTIDQLAWTVGATVRNVRAYQERGLLPAPEKRGRTGIYTDAHLARLRMIQRLLDRGYTLNSIGELLQAWQQGRDLGDLLGLEDAVTRPFVEEMPDYATTADLIKRFKKFSPELIKQATELGLLIPEGRNRYRVTSPRLLTAGEELSRIGIPLSKLFDVVGGLRNNVERVAEMLVQLVAEYVFDRHWKDTLPSKDEVGKLAEVIWQLRPLVDMAVQPEVARAMEKALEKILGDRLELIAKHYQVDDAK